MSGASLATTIGLTCDFRGSDEYALSVYEYALDADYPREPLDQLKAPWRKALADVGDGAVMTSSKPGEGQGQTVIDFDAGPARWRMIGQSPSAAPTKTDDLTIRIAKVIAKKSAETGPLVMSKLAQ